MPGACDRDGNEGSDFCPGAAGDRCLRSLFNQYCSGRYSEILREDVVAMERDENSRSIPNNKCIGAKTQPIRTRPLAHHRDWSHHRPKTRPVTKPNIDLDSRADATRVLGGNRPAPHSPITQSRCRGVPWNTNIQ